MSYTSRYKVGQTLQKRFYVAFFKKGGMGEIYFCFDLKNGIPCVLKTFKKDYLPDVQLKNEFEGEVEKWICLGEHPNIVTCFWMEYIDNIPFMCLEWVVNHDFENADLRTLIRHGPLNLKYALQFMIDICQGLVHAYSKVKGLVHCDLKPENILIMQGKIAKITDFGLSKVITTVHSELPEMENNFSGSSLLHGVSGTPPYMAPEQWLGCDLDERTDIYALGCILYEILTSKYLFSGFSPEDFKSKHLFFDVTSIIRSASIPTSLQSVIIDCLQKQKEKRISSVSELSQKLEEIYKNLFRISPIFYKSDPEYSLYHRNNIAATLATLERYDEALVFLNGILSEVDEPIAYGNRATLYRSIGNYDQALNDAKNAIRLDPNYGLAYNNAATVLGLMGNYEEALLHHNKSIELEPNNPSFYCNRGITLRLSGRQEEAIKDFEYALQLDPTSARIYINRSVIYVEQKEYEKALEEINKAIELDPFSYEAYVQRGSVFDEIANYASALSDYDFGIKIHPEKSEAYGLKGITLERLGQKDEALKEFCKAIDINNRDDKVFFNRGCLYESMGNNEKALSDYSSAFQINPNQFPALINRARLLSEIERFSEALVDCNLAINLKPDDVDVYLLRASIFRSIRDFDNAFNDLNRAFELNPKLAKIYLERGSTYSEIGNDLEAIGDLSKAIEIEPDSWVAFFNRGIVYLRIRLFDRALVDINKSLELNPNSAISYAYRGNIYSVLERFDEAFEDFHEAVRLDPKSPIVYKMRGTAYSLLHKYNEAIEEYNHAICIDPDFSDAYIKRGFAFAELARPLDGIRDINKGIQLSPDNSENYLSGGLFLINLKRMRLAYSYLNKAAEMGNPMAKDFANSAKIFLVVSCFTNNSQNVEDFVREVRSLPFFIDDKVVDGFHDSIERVQQFQPGYGNEFLNSLRKLSIEQRLQSYPEVTFTFTESLEGEENSFLYDYLPLRQEQKGPLETIEETVKNMLLSAANQIEHGNYYKAIDILTTALNIAPSDPVLFISRSHAYSQLKDFVSALSDINQAIRINPEDTSPVIFKGILCLETQEFESAMACFNQVLRMKPSKFDCIFIAEQLFKEEKYKDAMRFYEVAALMGDQEAGEKVRNIISGLFFEAWLQSTSIEQARKTLLEYPHVCSRLFLSHAYNSFFSNDNLHGENPSEVEVYRGNIELLLQATNEVGIEFFLVQKSMLEKFVIAIDDHALEEIANNYPFLKIPGYVYLLIGVLMSAAPADLKDVFLKRMARLYEIINSISISNEVRG